MDFRLTEERQMLQDALRRFLADTVTPEGIVEATGTATGFAPALWEQLTELGLPGAMFTEEQGGFGGAGFDLMVVFEELGRAGLSVPLVETVLSGALLDAAGMPVDDLAGGQILALAHTEPAARYDLNRVDTRAERTAEGWRVIGQKAVVHHAPAAKAILLTARTSGAADAEEGISLFLVTPADVTLRDYPLQGGGRAAELTIDATLPESALIGPAGTAFDALQTAHARATAALCAEALGMMETVKTLTVDYLRQRRQFGQPIGKFQALQHRMADVLIEIEQARSAVINLCGNLDGPDRDLHVSATKNLIGRTARLVVEEAIQMHGGIGMTMEYALGHFAKRLTMVDHRFGDTDYHLERFIRQAKSRAS
ncbi:acyl-CoA dehydrogenase family protein [Sagittula salina]|uniref:Acyl-CoA dehydrogenase family protein n=1 Tax=Sagittula salina TaxID=2820268 RepID=A0A940MSE3_9RHOB|nr:acyl-CoA dehydrogenase [Sagittula salina]MBP0482129.1 acyl-CoA dehydrogenase family protein [Sagittula salina]